MGCWLHLCASIASLIQGPLAKAIDGHDCFDIPGCWMAMQRSVRNLGRSGLAACAISAVDTALWDLKARTLDLPLATLLGRCRDRVPIYGSGGFTTYSADQLRAQLSGWVERDGWSAASPSAIRNGWRKQDRPSAIMNCLSTPTAHGQSSRHWILSIIAPT